MSLRMPLELLSKLRESSVEVIVKLKDGSEYKGFLEDVDLAMNIILSEAVQVGEDGSLIVKYGRVFIRGSNILYIYPSGVKVIF
ncbi:MAG: ribonucleoprotein [Thermofilaceae archaeon]|nr:ribonucleoprotein [Thermofilaceae archaeon]MCX8180637.1 ribonucleoprotein [Thermofilaceae archaeon]MDW8003739.1 LSM domain-containing protein [Thermofilaceae archaeon]